MSLAIVEGAGQSPILTPNEVNHALKQVTFAEQALNGNTNLNKIGLWPAPSTIAFA
jgi:hypothetical protein